MARKTTRTATGLSRSELSREENRSEAKKTEEAKNTGNWSKDSKKGNSRAGLAGQAWGSGERMQQ